MKKNTWALKLYLIHSGNELDSELNLPSLTEDKKYNINKSETKAMNARVTWKNGLTFTGTADTGFSLPLGADPAVGGDDDGFRPMELIAIGLIGCTAMDVISILKKMRVEVESFSMNISGELNEEHPMSYKKIHVTYEFKGKDLPEDKLQRAVELSQEKYCGVIASLKQSVEVDFEIKS